MFNNFFYSCFSKIRWHIFYIRPFVIFKPLSFFKISCYFSIIIFI